MASGRMFISFKTVDSHPVAKGLAGGRVRVQAGETVQGAICRRIAQDTRTEVVHAAEESSGDGASRVVYRLSLRGNRGHSSRSVSVEGVIRVQVMP